MNIEKPLPQDVITFFNLSIRNIEQFRNELPSTLFVAAQSETTKEIFIGKISNDPDCTLVHEPKSIRPLDYGMNFLTFLDSMIELVATRAMVCDKDIFRLIRMDSKGTIAYKYLDKERNRVAVQREGGIILLYLCQ